MRGKIPKMESLVIFEVVARHENYTRVAGELALVQSTIFRQVNVLEGFLNIALFNHAEERIFLNVAGKYYLSIVKETLNKLERDMTTIMTWQPTVQVIELAVNPTLSTHWSTPDLCEFNKLNPDTIVDIHSLADIGDFFNREYDVAIMHEGFYSPWSGVEYLSEGEILPVCSHCLLIEPERRLAMNELLNESPLLH